MSLGKPEMARQCRALPWSLRVLLCPQLAAYYLFLHKGEGTAGGGGDNGGDGDDDSDDGDDGGGAVTVLMV